MPKNSVTNSSSNKKKSTATKPKTSTTAKKPVAKTTAKTTPKPPATPIIKEEEVKVFEAETVATETVETSPEVKTVPMLKTEVIKEEKEVETTVAEDIKTVSNRDTEIEALKAQLAVLMNLVGNNTMTNTAAPSEGQRARRRIKLTSLCYGTLTLYHPQKGYLRFNQYGASQLVTYDNLVEYLNSNREAAEKGLFYIEDEEAVSDFSLINQYKKIFSFSLVNGLIANNPDFDRSEALVKIKESTEDQKNSLADYVAIKTFNKEINDLNLVDDISGATGIDIMTKIQQLREYNIINEDSED